MDIPETVKNELKKPLGKFVELSQMKKIAQKKKFLNGKRKYTMAKADSSEIAILPKVMTNAVIRLTCIMCKTGALDPAP